MAGARALWTGTISVSAVHVPVKLYPAVRENTIHFHQLHDADQVRLQQKMICPTENVEVHREHIVKGYEIAPDRYLIINEEDLEKVKPAPSRLIEIDRFVDAASIDPLYYDRPYYLGPGEHGAKAYALLSQALQKTGRAAIVRFVMRSKEYLAALRTMDDGALCLVTLRYHDEVIKSSDLDEAPAKAHLEERELKVAQQIIDTMTKHFEAAQYKDEYIQRVRDLIEKKAHGQTVPTAHPRRAAQTSNLLSTLEASLKQVQGKSDNRKPVAATHRRSR